MSQWRSLINDGNDFFHNGSWQEAEYCYKEAVYHLDFLRSADTKNVPLLMAWIHVHHSLASLFEVQESLDLSLQYLLIPHNQMVSVSTSDGCCEDSKLISQNALKLTFMPIFMFSKRHPICESCQDSLAEFKAKLDLCQLATH